MLDLQKDYKNIEKGLNMLKKRLGKMIYLMTNRRVHNQSISMSLLAYDR